jgi:hypothetical protein
MREILSIPVEHIRPDRSSILETQGIPSGQGLSEEVNGLLKKAVEMFLEFSRPVSVISAISVSEFKVVYHGEGLNETGTPLAEIMEQADDLALFAVTVGEDVTGKIKELFDINEFALGSMMDSAASAGTDRAADFVESRFFALLSEQGKIAQDKSVMRFSPGYCGWHMSGQKKLFEFLHPEDIGIRLLDSFLMQPLKSISGVMVLGDRGIFNFQDSYGICSQCRSHTCRERIKRLMRTTSTNSRKGAS